MLSQVAIALNLTLTLSGVARGGLGGLGPPFEMSKATILKKYHVFDPKFALSKIFACGGHVFLLFQHTLALNLPKQGKRLAL